MLITPNPTQDNSILFFEKPEEIKEILIFDMSGKLSKRFDAKEIKSGNQYEMITNQLPTGNYIVRTLSITGVQYSKKLVIIH